ncbi:MAG TPA: hypothetical protein VLP30_06470, partial [Desulfatirhabdiaceae bacterium]|nr:hypothetical protein [Desulfatirhabdiaceae bacterium]
SIPHRSCSFPGYFHVPFGVNKSDMHEATFIQFAFENHQRQDRRVSLRNTRIGMDLSINCAVPSMSDERLKEPLMVPLAIFQQCFSYIAFKIMILGRQQGGDRPFWAIPDR